MVDRTTEAAIPFGNLSRRMHVYAFIFVLLRAVHEASVLQNNLSSIYFREGKAHFFINIIITILIIVIVLALKN